MRNAAIISKNWFSNFRSTRLSGLSGFSGIDGWFLATVVGLVIFGLIMVYSSSFIFAQERTGDGFSFIKKQLIYSLLGIGAVYLGLTLEIRKLRQWAYPILGIATLLLAMIWIPGVGVRVGGAQRWIRLGFFNFQPAEFMKLAAVVFAAYQLERKQDRLHRFSPGILSPVVPLFPAFILLLAQPDFGSIVLMSIVLLALLFLAGVPLKNLMVAVVSAGFAGASLALSSEYRRERLLGFLDPWKDPGGRGFQVLQSQLGVHNGHVWGVGLGNGKEKLLFLPEAHNDFIFAVIGEELGFIGIILVVLSFLFLIYRGLRIAWTAYSKQKDHFSMLLASGLTLALGIQAFVNMAVVLGALPTKGLPLPFVSYGGSALLMNLFAVGLILNVSRKGRPVSLARGSDA